MADIIYLNPDDYLVRETEESSNMYYLQEGMLAIYKLRGGVEQQIGTIYAGELVGEMSFLDKGPRSASVRAVKECTLTVIPSEKFQNFLSSQPIWYQKLIQTLLDRLRRANTRIKI